MRSQLEVTASNVLRARGIQFIYEPRSIELGNGEAYIPDFYCHWLSTFLELKSAGHAERLHKPWILARQLQEHRPWMRLLLWQGNDLLWSATPTGWRSIHWIRCSICGSWEFYETDEDLDGHSICGDSPTSNDHNNGHDFRLVSRKKIGAHNPVRRWRPSRDDIESAALRT